MNCKDCKYAIKNEHNRFMPQLICTSEKLGEDIPDPEDDMLVYSYQEGGYFHVGQNFGCVHFKPR